MFETKNHVHQSTRPTPQKNNGVMHTPKQVLRESKLPGVDPRDITRELFSATYHLGDMGQMIRESHCVDIAGAMLEGNIPIIHQVNTVMSSEVNEVHMNMTLHNGYTDLCSRAVVQQAVDLSVQNGYLAL